MARWWTLRGTLMCEHHTSWMALERCGLGSWHALLLPCWQSSHPVQVLNFRGVLMCATAATCC